MDCHGDGDWRTALRLGTSDVLAWRGPLAGTLLRGRTLWDGDSAVADHWGACRLTRRENVLLIAVLALITLAGWVSPAAALEPGPLRVTSYELSVRPEFDTPDVLVINNAVLVNPSDQPYQGRIGFRVPKGAELQMVCEIGPGGGHACQPFKSEDKGDYVEVWWNASRPITKGTPFPIYVEYYYDPFTSRAPKRFTHRFHPVYPMDNLYVVVTQPKGSSNFTISPKASLSRPVQDGTTDWQYSFTDLPAAPLEFQVQYEKPDDQPSVARPAKNQGGAPSGGAGPAGGTSPWTMTIVALLLVGVGVAFFVIAQGPRRNRSNGRPR